MRCDVVHPVILAVLPHQALPETGACLHGFGTMAVDAINLHGVRHADLRGSVGLDIRVLLMTADAQGIFAVPYRLPELMLDFGHAVGIMAHTAAKIGMPHAMQINCVDCHNPKTMQTGAGLGKGLARKDGKNYLVKDI